MTWFDAARGLRASARIEKPEDLDISYVRYLPLAKFFGAPGPVWGFEKPERPLIGATPDEIVAAYGKDYAIKRDDKAGTVTMSMPPTDYDSETSKTTILMFVRNGKIGDTKSSLEVSARSRVSRKDGLEMACLSRRRVRLHGVGRG